MSSIRATTISNLAGTGPATLTGQYAAKAWVNFNGTGTVAIRESANVASITDNGTGDYTVNFTTTMTDVNYIACPSVASGGVNSGSSAAFVNTQASMTTSSIRLGLTDFTSSGDRNYVSVAITR